MRRGVVWRGRGLQYSPGHRWVSTLQGAAPLAFAVALAVAHCGPQGSPRTAPARPARLTMNNARQSGRISARFTEGSGGNRRELLWSWISWMVWSRCEPSRVKPNGLIREPFKSVISVRVISTPAQTDKQTLRSRCQPGASHPSEGAVRGVAGCLLIHIEMEARITC